MANTFSLSGPMGKTTTRDDDQQQAKSAPPDALATVDLADPLADGLGGGGTYDPGPATKDDDVEEEEETITDEPTVDPGNDVTPDDGNNGNGDDNGGGDDNNGPGDKGTPSGNIPSGGGPTDGPNNGNTPAKHDGGKKQGGGSAPTSGGPTNDLDDGGNGNVGGDVKGPNKDQAVTNGDEPSPLVNEEQGNNDSGSEGAGGTVDLSGPIQEQTNVPTDATPPPFPDIDGGPFGPSDVVLPPLDTSGYKRDRRAAKATALYGSIADAVARRIAELIAMAQAESASANAQVDAERQAHLSGIATSRSTLASNLATARAALDSESSAAMDRLTGRIAEKRSAIQADASKARTTITGAASSMEQKVAAAAVKAGTDYSAGFDRASLQIDDGINDFKVSVQKRLSQAKSELALTGYGPIWTCVHYRIRKSLGDKFGATGPVIKALGELKTSNDAVLLETYATGRGKIDNVRKQGMSAASTAKKSGLSAINSQEKRALAALDETEAKIVAQMKAATAQATAGLDAIEQSRNAALDQAAAQVNADADSLKSSLTGAIWSSARLQAQALIQTAIAAAAPLREKPRQKYVDAAIATVNAFVFSLQPAADGARSSVAAWAAGHTSARAQLDGSAASGAEGWRADALQRVADAEARAHASIDSTATGSIDSLSTMASERAKQISQNTASARTSFGTTVSKQTGNLIGIGRQFILGLDTALGTDELGDLKRLREKGYNTLHPDLVKRAMNLKAGMFDAGLFNGTDETKVFNNLRGIGKYGGPALSDVYKDYANRKSLINDLYNDLTNSEYKIARAYYDGDDGKGIKLELAYYQDGWFGDDEDAIKALLKDIDDEQLAALKNEPGWEQAAEHLYANLDDDATDVRIVQSLIAGNKARAEALELIDKITDARWNEDTDALRDIIAGIPADSRQEILLEFAMLHELAGKKGGLADVNFKKKETDPELAAKYSESAVDADGNPITVTNDDLTTRNVTKAEQAFGSWVTEDNLKGDALYKEGSAGVGNRIKHAFTDSDMGPGGIGASYLIGSPVLVGYGIANGMYNDANSETGNREMGKDEKELLGIQAMYGNTSMQGRAAEVHYEATKGESTEKAYNALAYEHTDEDGNVTNSAFKSADERNASHEEWQKTFDEIYSQQHGGSASDDIRKGFEGKDYRVLNETHQGGQASADAMFNHAEDGGMFGLGTNEWAAEKALENADQADIIAYFKKNPGRKDQLLSEFSGDELEKMQILMVGKVKTDKQRWEIAKIRWNFTRGEGSGSLNMVVGYAMGGPHGAALMEAGAPKISANLFWDLISDAGEDMDFNYEKLKAMIDARGGEANAFDENGMLVMLSDAGSDAAIEEMQDFRGSTEALEYAEETYHSTVDVYTDLIATVAGLIAAIVVEIVSVGTATPLVAALVGGLVTMGSKAALKGDRYGQEEMYKDGAILAIEVATAGLATKVTKMAKMSQFNKLTDAQKLTKFGTLEVAEATVLKTIKLTKGTQATIKAGEAYLSSSGKALISEDTWEKGWADGLKKAFIEEGGSAVATTYMDNLIDGLGEKMYDPISKGAFARPDWKNDLIGIGVEGITNLGKDESSALISDLFKNENSFGEKQGEFAKNAMWAMMGKSMTVRSERKSDQASELSDWNKEQDKKEGLYQNGEDNPLQDVLDEHADETKTTATNRKNMTKVATTVAKTGFKENGY